MKHLLLFSLLVAQSCLAAVYDCETQVGETVAIRKVVLKENTICPTCSEPGSAIPAELMDKAQSEEWPENEYVKTIPGLTTKYKRRVIISMGRTVYLETRYVHHKFNTFEFEMTCAPGNDPEWPETSHCEGGFKNLDREKIAVELPNFDKRAERHSRVEITMGHKPHLGFIVRLFKDAVYPNGRRSRISSSGEMKFFSEEPLFIQDTAVNEPLPLLGEDYFDREALELKIICRKTKR